MFCCLEGLRGVGKSTTAQRLADTIGGKYLPYTLGSDSAERRRTDSQDDLLGRFKTYVDMMFRLSTHIESTIASGVPVVVESYIYRTIAYHKGIGLDIPSVPPEGLLLPDLAFHLTCEESVRQGRIAARNQPPSRWDLVSERYTDAILEAYAHFGMIQVDTTHVSPTSLVRLLAEQVKLRH
jgi:thymidylate kinase